MSLSLLVVGTGSLTEKEIKIVIDCYKSYEENI